MSDPTCTCGRLASTSTHHGVTTCLKCKKPVARAKTFGPNETAQEARETIAKLVDQHLAMPIRSLPTLTVREHYAILESIKRAAMDGEGYL
jgi:hypothetical protein